MKHQCNVFEGILKDQRNHTLSGGQRLGKFGVQAQKTTVLRLVAEDTSAGFDVQLPAGEMYIV